MSRADLRDYPTKIKVSDEEMESINIIRNSFHGDWNYCILPQSEASNT